MVSCFANNTVVGTAATSLTLEQEQTKKRMKKNNYYKEKYITNTFWLRSPFLKNQSRWKKKALTSTVILLSFFFFFLLLGYLDFSMYSIHSKKIILNSKKSTQSTTYEFTLQCKTWNQTLRCPKDYPTKHKPSLDPDHRSNPTCPDYFRWIHEDLRHWKETGITRDMVDSAGKTAHFKLVVVDGKAYVEKYRKSIQTRDLFTLWGIVQLLRWYPGRLPDLELMFDCNDRPVIQSKYFRRPNSGPPPLFRYCSDWQSLDIVFPDWSFWGWAETNIRPWKRVIEEIKEGNRRTKWKDRVPFAYWRGNPHVAPTRADLMKCNLTDKFDWNARLFVQDWIKESKEGYKESKLGNQCTYRYKIYVEGWAWSVSEKYILACDSPTLLITPRYHDFFTRGMVPLKHYWPIRDNNKCKSLKFAVEWGNNHTSQAEAIGKASSHYIHDDLKMNYVYDYMLHLLSGYAKLQTFKPTIPDKAIELCPEAMACLTDKNWDNFMEESLVKSPSDTIPCTMPPPYDPQSLEAFIDEKVKSTKQVEMWENEYWDNINKHQLGH